MLARILEIAEETGMDSAVPDHPLLAEPQKSKEVQGPLAVS